MTGWLRVSLGRRCPVCGRGDWCLVASDGTAAICPRAHDGALRRVGDAGWLHRLNDAAVPLDHAPPLTVRNTISASTHDFGALARRYAEHVAPSRLSTLATSLGVSGASLRRLGVGWDGCAFTFPMSNATGRVIGIRRRFTDGGKRARRGSRNGLFIPTGLAGAGRLFIAEGATDTAALLDLGLEAVGRPSCTGGTAHMTDYTRRRHVVIVADRDEPGRAGAIRLATALERSCSTVAVILPPPGIKDAREWVRAGATRADVEETLARPRIRDPRRTKWSAPGECDVGTE